MLFLIPSKDLFVLSAVLIPAPPSVSMSVFRFRGHRIAQHQGAPLRPLSKVADIFMHAARLNISAENEPVKIVKPMSIRAWENFNGNEERGRPVLGMEHIVRNEIFSFFSLYVAKSRLSQPRWKPRLGWNWNLDRVRTRKWSQGEGQWIGREAICGYSDTPHSNPDTFACHIISIKNFTNFLWSGKVQRTWETQSRFPEVSRPQLQILKNRWK